MKKIFAWVLVIISVLCLFGCDEQNNNEQNNKDNKYKLTVVDNFNYLTESLEEYYEAGEEVEVCLKYLSELTKVGFILNDRLIKNGGETTSDKNGNKIITFTFNMPNKDSTLYTTRNGYVQDDCGEAHHTWNEGQILDVPGGGKDKVYTCTLCGKTKSERVSSPITYKVTVTGAVNFLAENLCAEYASGQRVCVKTDILIDADIAVYVNDTKIEQDKTSNDPNYWYYWFEMPNEDVVVKIEVI